MGNFSRDTYDRRKNYVAVRLQQGVPLVDADWNELQDTTRHELYQGLGAALPSVARRGSLDLQPANAGASIVLRPGSAVIDGWPINVWEPLNYAKQRYVNAAVAQADGVDPVTPVPLPPPPGPRQDVVYLDVFEREVGPGEDGGLVNAAIGVETAVRMRREVVLRVAEGGPPPAPPAGHRFLEIALLNRGPSPITAGQIVDIKPYPLPLGPRQIAFSPWLLPVDVTVSGISDRWELAMGFGAPPRLYARKPAGAAGAVGVLPLNLPDGARVTHLQIHGRIIAGAGGPANLFVKLVRCPSDGGAPATVAEESVSGSGDFDRTVATNPAEAVVDNSTSFYFLHLLAVGGGVVEVNGGHLRYVP